MSVNTTPVIDDAYMRSNFRIETAVPKQVIDRSIIHVRDVYAYYFGNTYTDAELDNQQPTPNDPDLIDKFQTSMGYLVMARLLSEQYVATGFGVVVKKDEFSEDTGFDRPQSIARQYINDASVILHTIPNLPDITEAVTEATSNTERFFPKKRSNLWKYYPYTMWF